MLRVFRGKMPLEGCVYRLSLPLFISVSPPATVSARKEKTKKSPTRIFGSQRCSRRNRDNESGGIMTSLAKWF